MSHLDLVHPAHGRGSEARVARSTARS